jgi:hypothetical protein
MMMMVMNVMFTLALRVMLVMLVLKLFQTRWWTRGWLRRLLPPIENTATVSSQSHRDSSKAGV